MSGLHLGLSTGQSSGGASVVGNRKSRPEPPESPKLKKRLMDRKAKVNKY